MKKGTLAAVIVVFILVVDQLIKIWVKTHMMLHESIEITPWFYILFIENNGMAFGMQLGSKVLLSLFRLFAIGGLIYFIWWEIKRRNARWGYVATLAMILAGAAGNLIDCLFYGQIFSASSSFYTSYFVPFGEGYAPLLFGKVVDMFYFPIIETTWPAWMPFVGGEEFVFFSPVFNFADASISVGVVLLILFYRKEISSLSFSEMKKSGKNEAEKSSE